MDFPSVTDAETGTTTCILIYSIIHWTVVLDLTKLVFVFRESPPLVCVCVCLLSPRPGSDRVKAFTAVHSSN